MGMRPARMRVGEAGGGGRRGVEHASLGLRNRIKYT